MLWKTVVGFKDYEVSDTGSVRYKKEVHISVRTERVRPQYICNSGYFRIHLKKDGKWYAKLVHRLVLEAFIGPIPKNGYVTDHRDENKLNNTVKNLRWITQSQNVLRSKKLGQRKRFFYEGELWLIKRLLKNRIPRWKIGKMFKCSISLIYKISRGMKDLDIKPIIINSI
jgi:hypothetical protein